MLVTILEITKEEKERETEREGGGGGEEVWSRGSEVMTERPDVWNQSKPRGAPAEGLPLAKVRSSGRMPHHSQGPPGAEQGGKQAKLEMVKTDTQNPHPRTRPIPA